MTARPPVVLLHGWGGTFRSTWIAAGWVEALAGLGRRVIPIDLPGHGPRASHDPAAYGDLAGAVAAMLPDRPLELIGFSLGAKLALALAARTPERFGRIVLGGVGDNVFAPERAGETLAAALTGGVDAAAPAPLRDLVRYGLESGGDPAALAAVLRRAPNPVLAEADLTGIGAVLLVNGDQDTIARPDVGLRNTLPRCTYCPVANVGHLDLPGTEPFRTAALAFLER